MNTRTLARVLLASVGWMALSLGAALAVTLPFYDGFENVPAGYYPTPNGWRTWTSGVTAYVSGSFAHSGARSFRLHSYSYWSRCDYVLLDQVPDHLAYQASVYVDPIAGRAAWIGLAHGAGFDLPFYNYFTLRNNGAGVGTVHFTSATGMPPLFLGQFAISTWATVMADLNFRNLTADLWLDGFLVAAGVPIEPKEFDDPALGHVMLNRLAIAECNWPGRSTGVIYLDDVAAFESAPDPVEATVDIQPDTLNKRSAGRWVTCYIELPEGFSVMDVDLASLLLNDSVPPQQWPVSIGDYDYDGVPDLMVKFSRSALAALLSPGQRDVTLTGALSDGTPLIGTDTLRVLP